MCCGVSCPSLPYAAIEIWLQARAYIKQPPAALITCLQRIKNTVTYNCNTMSEKRTLIAVLGDEDTTTGLLLAGIGQNDASTGAKNFFVYHEDKTTKEQLEAKFREFTQERKDIAIVLVNQFVADIIRATVDAYVEPFPAILEIPSKDHPYDPEKDSVLKRVRKLFGE